MISICACDTNQEEVSGNNLGIQNNEATNQENITSNTTDLNNGENIKEILNEEPKESGNKTVEILEKIDNQVEN